MFGRLQKLLLTTTALVPLGFAPAVANPLGGQVVGGSATVQGQGTATATVTQQTASAIINWNTFNIGAGEKTNIAMPSASSVQLDRVTGGLGPSQILGSLWSNGRVFLVNPDGILFGPGAKIDTSSLLATTHDIANADFMSGRYNFSIPGNPTASVVNQGTITAQSGGFAALVAPGVRNSGTITAKLGTIALASGNDFTLDFYGDKLITLGVSESIAAQVKDVSTGQPLSSLVSNAGKLKANGGTVELTVVAARQVVDSVINNTGVIEANTIGTHNGMIVLSAATASSKPADAPTQMVKVSGTLSAAGKKKGTTGGTVVVTGENIAVSGATIDASGQAGGGTVLIGGDTGGGNPNAAVASIPQTQLQHYAVSTASNVTVDAATTIDASAKDAGNGGKVIVWADQSTLFDGSISVRGATAFGNGGFVEVSGHQALAFNGTVDLAAPQGSKGILLLDPQDVTIGSTGTWIVTPSALQTALASGDVIVTTGSGSGNGDITVAQSISWANASALTLSAYRNIAVNANITNTGSAAVTLQADNTGTGVGTVSFGSGAQVSTAGPVSIFYNPSVNLAGSVVNTTSYVNPTENFTSDVTGGGLLTAYMLVNTVYDLQNIQNNLFGSYALGKDIDASPAINWNSGAGFMPIGGVCGPNGCGVCGYSGCVGYSGGFSGVFDGRNHVIDQLTINQGPAITTPGYSPDYFYGLFSYIGTAGTVRNVGLTNEIVQAGPPFGFVGGLAAMNWGTISRAYVTGTNYADAASSAGGLVAVSYGTINQSYAIVAIPYFNDSVGGLVGSNSGTIWQSYATGSLTGSGYEVGGLVGTNSGPIIQSYATGAVVGSGSVAGSGGYQAGGLVGYNVGGTISESYATGAVGGSAARSGGLVGLSPFAPNEVTGSYWDIQTTGQLYDGSYSGSGSTGLTTAQFKSGLPSGFDPTVWGSNPNINNGYPYLKWQTASTPSPTIITPQQLQIITVDADPETKIYGSIDPFLAYTIVSGNLGSATFSGTLTRAPGQNVGSHAISEGSLSLPAGYEINFVNSALAITPATLTYAANPVSRVYGSLNPTLSGSVTGFVNGDTVASATTGVEAFTTLATASSNVGNYAIMGSGLTANYGNYVFVQVPGNATALTITPATLTLTYMANDVSRTYGSSNPIFTGSVTGFVKGDTQASATTGTLTFSTVATASSNVGSYAITGSGLSANFGNYAFNQAPGNATALTINPRPVTVAATTQSKIYGNTDPTLTYQLTSGSLFGTDTFSGSLSRNTGEGVGTYAITQGSLNLSSNYALTYVGNNLFITARPITITANPESKTYGDANPSLTYSVGGQGLMNGDTLAGSLATAATVTSGVGAYGINQGSLAASANYALTYKGANLTVNPRPVTVAANAQTKTYGGDDPTLTYHLSSGTLVGTDAFASGLVRAPGENVGAYSINMGSLSLGANYALAYLGNNLTITPAPLVISADDKSRAPGVSNPAFTASYSGFVRGDGASVVSGLTFATPATPSSANGTYPIVPSGASAANYSISYVNGTLTVTPTLLIPITVTADYLSKIYGNADSILTYQVTSGSLAGTSGLTGAETRSAGQNVGSYPITEGTLAVPPGYILNFVGATFTINPRPVTVAATTQSKIYGNTDPTLTYQLTSGSLVGIDAFTGSLSRNTGEGVGTYAIAQGSLNLSSNYALTYVGNNLFITARPITITANPESKTYGDANPSLTYSVGGQGLMNGDTLAGSLATVATVTSGVGAYVITQGTLANSNYALTYVGANLTVNRRPVTVAADPETKVFGTADALLKYYLTSGSLVGTNAFSGALSRNPGQNVGTYAINQGSLSLGLNYALTYVGNYLTITPAPVTVAVFSTGQTSFFSNPINTQISGSTPSTVITVVPTSGSAIEATNNLVNFVLDCASNCVTAPFKAGLDILVNQVLVSSGYVPTSTSEPIRYQIIAPSGRLVVDVVVVAVAVAAGASLPVTLTAVGAASLIYEVSELVVRPFPVN